MLYELFCVCAKISISSMLDLQFLNYSNIKGNEAEFEENWFFM